MLKYTIAKLEDVDEKFRDLYKKADDGSFVLDVEGNPLKTKINEFRAKNTDLLQKQEDATKNQAALQAKNEALAKDIMSLKTKKKEGDNKGTQDNEQITQLATQIKDMQTMLQKKDERQAESDKRYAQEKIRTGLTTAIQTVATVRKGALEDVLRRGESVFSLDDSLNPVAKKSDGTLILNDKGDKITFDEYAKMLVTEAPFLFEGNKGGGGDGDTGQGNLTTITSDQIMNNLDDVASGKVVVQ